ncbi:hypothetical protein HDU79_011622 [Rhizoclosmatium sp. JEL0117]|nr:hypothetical protein HDU79_011622 [Rhizoclosmatium sp. JEL0117]
MLPAIPTQERHVSLKDEAPSTEPAKPVQIDQDIATEIANEISQKQIPYVHAYQFHGYDPSRDPLLIRKQPILRPLVDFKGLEFHRHWPLEYLSQRLQKEREKELSHFRKLFQLRVSNPYVGTSELEYYKMSTVTKTRQLHEHNHHHHQHALHKIRRPSHHHTREEAAADALSHAPGLPPKQKYHPHPPRHKNIPTDLQSPHILQQKLKTRYQKYRYLLHLPSHPTNPPSTRSDGSVFTRLAQHTQCKHFVEEVDNARPHCIHHHQPPPPPDFFTRMATPKPIPPPPQPIQLQPKDHPPPSQAAIERLSKPRVVYPVYQFPESGIPKEVSEWRPMTHRLVMSEKQLQRMEAISRPKNWREIEEKKKAEASEAVGAAATAVVPGKDAGGDVKPPAEAVAGGEGGSGSAEVEQSGSSSAPPPESTEQVEPTAPQSEPAQPSSKHPTAPSSKRTSLSNLAQRLSTSLQNLTSPKKRASTIKAESQDPSTTQSQSQDQNTAQEPLLDPSQATDEQKEAAVKLQATFRGYKTRQKLSRDTLNNPESDDSAHPVEPPSTDAVTVPAEESREANTDDTTDQLLDPAQATEEQHEAAVKLQATFRGFKTRQKLSRDTLNKPETEEPVEAGGEDGGATTVPAEESKEVDTEGGVDAAAPAEEVAVAEDQVPSSEAQADPESAPVVESEAVQEQSAESSEVVATEASVEEPKSEEPVPTDESASRPVEDVSPEVSAPIEESEEAPKEAVATDEETVPQPPTDSESVPA